MEFNISFKTGKKDKSIEKSTKVNSFRSTTQFERTADGIFYPIDLSSKTHASALIDMYETLPEVQIPINYFIDKMANIPYYHVKITRGGKETIIPKSNVKDVMKAPNQYMGEADFIKAWFLNRMVLGVAYTNRIIPMGMNEVSQLYVLPSATTKPAINVVSKKDPRQNSINGYIVDFGNGEVKLSHEEVVVEYEANLCSKLDEIKSRLMAAILTSESLRYNYEARVKIYKDRGALGVLSPKEAAVAVTKTQADEMRDQYYQEHGITGGKAPFMVTPRALTYTQIGFNVDELKLNDNKLQDFNTVCNLIGIDPALFDNTRATYNNKKLAKTNFWEDGGMPRFNSFLQLLGKVFNLPENEKLKADYSEVPALQTDYKTKVESNSKAYNDGAITHAEYRESIGFEGGEESYKSTGTEATSGETNE